MVAGSSPVGMGVLASAGSHRVLLILLYAPPLIRIARLTVANIELDDGEVRLRSHSRNGFLDTDEAFSSDDGASTSGD